MKRPKRLLVVFNPKAAHGRAGRRLEEIRAALGTLNIGANVETTQHRGHAEEVVRTSRLEEYHGVAAAGGDGTLFETLNGLMAHAPGERPPLGLIPLGTGNAFARDLGLEPGAWREGIDLIARGVTRRVDVGRLESGSDRFCFLNVAGLGFVAEAGRASARLKFTGPLAYTLGTLKSCLGLQSRELEVEVDGQSIRQESLLMEISNSRYTGTSFLIAPKAEIDDGLLDIVMVSDLSLWRLLRLFPSIYSGRHVDHQEVAALQGRRVDIHAPAGLEFMVDGEFRGTTPARIECLPGAIEMFAGPPV